MPTCGSRSLFGPPAFPPSLPVTHAIAFEQYSVCAIARDCDSRRSLVGPLSLKVTCDMKQTGFPRLNDLQGKTQVSIARGRGMTTTRDNRIALTPFTYNRSHTPPQRASVTPTSHT